MSNDIKTKRFYNTGFIPLSNDNTRKKRGLDSQLITNSCSSVMDNKSNVNISNINNLMYPVPPTKLTYGLSQIPTNSRCLKYLHSV